MKHIGNFIDESWEFQSNIHDTTGDVINIPKAAKWLLINTETEIISAITEKDLDSFKDDFDDEETGPAVKKLKIGESYDADGGINIYLRIKK
jgi:acyl-ACP thioesterase